MDKHLFLKQWELASTYSDRRLEHSLSLYVLHLALLEVYV